MARPTVNKQTKKITTKAYDGKRGEGRSVVLRASNKDAVISWIGPKLLAFAGSVDKLGKKPKLKIKTSRGVRVAVEGDTIVKFGTFRNGSDEVTFQVIKAGEE